MPTAIIAYVPVLHDGYRQFFAKHQEAETIYLLSAELIGEFPHLAKEIRALSPELVRQSLSAWQLPQQVTLLDVTTLKRIAADGTIVIAPDEDVLRELAERYLPDSTIVWDSVFLRWDRKQSLANQPIDGLAQVTADAFSQKMMQLAYREAARSADWWRQVGAVLIKDGQVLGVAHNAHVPTDHQLYIDGDPRNNFHKGDHIELSTAIHAEARIIAEAAKRGDSLVGCELYVSTFPCPPCAKLVAYSGIAKLYFAEGYAVLDGQTILKDQGVEILHVA